MAHGVHRSEAATRPFCGTPRFCGSRRERSSGFGLCVALVGMRGAGVGSTFLAPRAGLAWEGRLCSLFGLCEPVLWDAGWVGHGFVLLKYTICSPRLPLAQA